MTSETQHDPDQRELILLAQQGDGDAFGKLMRPHMTLLRSIVSKGFPYLETEDIVQEGLMSIWRTLVAYDPKDGAFQGWIVTIVRRKAIDFRRRKLAYDKAVDRLAKKVQREERFLVHREIDHTESGLDSVENIGELLNELPPLQRLAVRQFLQYRTQRQIAKQTRTPLGTIKTRLELAFRKIRAKVTASTQFRDVREKQDEFNPDEHDADEDAG